MYKFKNKKIKNNTINIILLVALEFIIFTTASIIFQENIIILGLLINLFLIVSYFLLIKDSILIILAITSSLILMYLTYNLNLNKNMNYILDYFILLMLVKSIIYIILKKIKFRKLYSFYIIFIVFSLVSAIFNKVDLMTYIKGLYFDYIRYGILIFSIINFKLSDTTIKRYIKFLWGFLLIQVPIVIFQDLYSKKYWYPKSPGDIRQDYIAGLMGARGTAELGTLICIALGCIFILYQNKKVSLKYFIISAVLLISILVISEIKFGFILLTIVFITISIIKPKLKNFIVILVSIVIMLIGISFLEKMYPQFNGFFQRDKIVFYLQTNYAGSNLNRLTAFNTANKEISKTTGNRLVGFGIGTSGGSKSKSVYSNEFQKHNIYNFEMFTWTQYLVENGWIGLLSIYGVFIYQIFASYIMMKKGRTQFEVILGTCGIHSGISIIIVTMYSMSITKINFAVVAYSIIGIIFRYYYKMTLKGNHEQSRKLHERRNICQ